MAQYNTANDSFQTHNKTLFEVNQIATANGVQVSNTNPFPVLIFGGNNVTTPVSVNFQTTLVDAFGRLRVSNPETLFDSTLRYTDDSRNWDTSNTANATYAVNANTSMVAMSVDTTNAEKVIRQTKRYFHYQPGKSLLILNSFVFAPGKTDLRQRIGYFDTQNGIFIERKDETTYFVKRSYVTGAVVDTPKAQGSWDIDNLDGTGPSGVTVDWTKAQIFWTDVEWLGVGSVRLGIVYNGQFIHCHTFHHANIISSTYMTTASLPLRAEIENLGTTASNSTMYSICSSIMSEGGFVPKAETRAASTALAGLAMSQTTYRPIVAIRLKSTNNKGIVVPSSFDLYGLQTTPFNYRILHDTTITGGTWVSAGTESHVEYNVTGTALTGGRVTSQGMFIGGTYVQPMRVSLLESNHSHQLKTRINGTTEVFCVAVIATTNNDDVLGTVEWQEFN